MLSIKNTKDPLIDPKTIKTIFNNSHYVDMHFEGFSNSDALFTDAIANCLAIVIHDVEKKGGYLMHVFPALAGGLHPYTLFNFVDNQIERALAELSPSKNINIFFWKGISFTPLILKDINLCYAEYAKHRFGTKAIVIDLMDKATISKETQLLYLPKEGEVVIIDSNHSKYFKSKNLKTDGTKPLPTSTQNIATVDKRMLEILNTKVITENNFYKSSNPLLTFSTNDTSVNNKKYDPNQNQSQLDFF